ncbi:general substrate transporter [Aspergillus crustosus]
MASRHYLPMYMLASMLCSFGGLLFGIDTGIIGSVVVMEQFVQRFGSFSPIVHGLIISSILIPAAVTSFFGGKLADWLGRPRSISVGALIFGIGAAMEAGAAHLAMFIVGRCIEGLGEGLYLGTLVVYICEISPPRQRGPLTTGPQLLITFGLVIGFFTCYGSERLSSSMAWKAPFVLLAGLSVVFSLAAFLWLPESPRWLAVYRRPGDVSRSWDYLEVKCEDREQIEQQSNPTRGEQIIFDAPISTGSILAPETLNQVVSQYSQPAKVEARFFEIFGRDVRIRTLLGVFLMGMQQLAGIDGVLYYAPLLFQQAGLGSEQIKFLASGVSGIVIFLVTIPALLFADKWSRRQSVILGGLGLTILMFVTGSLYAANAVHSSTGAGRWIVIVCIYLFAALYSASWGVSIKVYSAEIQPQRTRAPATCLAHGSNWISNFTVALITPVLLAESRYGAYFLFGGCALFTVVVCLFWMPETRGKPLHVIESEFGGKMNYQSTTDG